MLLNAMIKMNVYLLVSSAFVILLYTGRSQRSNTDTSPVRSVSKQHALSPSFLKEMPPNAILLPPPMDLIRRNISLQAIYNFPSAPQGTYVGHCSCVGTYASKVDKHGKCCQRNFRRAHKMGTMMTEHLFDEYGVKQYNRPYKYRYTSYLPKTDFRDVYLLRNIYSSIISGYLFHKEGNECDRNSSAGKFRKGEEYVNYWYHSLTFDAELVHIRTMCQYYEQEPLETGLIAYIEWAFRYQYAGFLSHVAFAMGLPLIQERSKIMCYEDLSSSEKDAQTIDTALTFLFNGTRNYQPYIGVLPGHKDYAGGHSTSHDTSLHTKLMDMIKKIDKERYHGEIAWLDSVLPC